MCVVCVIGTCADEYGLSTHIQRHTYMYVVSAGLGVVRVYVETYRAPKFYMCTIIMILSSSSALPILALLPEIEISLNLEPILCVKVSKNNPLDCLQDATG